MLQNDPHGNLHWAEEVNAAATGHVSLVRPASASWWHDPNLCYPLGCIFPFCLFPPPALLHIANVLNVQIKFKMSSLQRPRQRKLSSSSSNRDTATTITTSTAARVVLELEMKVKMRRLRRLQRRWQRLRSAAERKKLPTLTFKATVAVVVCVVVAGWLTTQKTTTKNIGCKCKATCGCANCNVRVKFLVNWKSSGIFLHISWQIFNNKLMKNCSYFKYKYIY